MVTVPAFLLRRLYVKGSLRNSDEGVQFQLMNKLGTGYAKRLLPLTLNGEDVPLEQSYYSVDGKECSFDSVSDSAPLTLDLNRSTTITIRGLKLSKVPQTIGFRFEVPGLGMLEFDFTDVP